MAFKRLKITPEIGPEFEVLYNPERYTLNKGVQYAEINIPGLDSPVLQFVRGQNEKITVELFYDTTERGMVGNVTDVRTETVKIYDLLKILPSTHAPRAASCSGGRGDSSSRSAPRSSRGACWRASARSSASSVPRECRSAPS